MPRNLLMTPAPVPSIARAAGNAMNFRSAQNRNLLAEKQLGNYDEDRKIQAQSRELQTEARAVSTALQAGNTEQATQVYKSLGGKSESGISIIGENVEIDYGNSTLSGPGAIVAEMMGKISEDPSWATNPKTQAWFAAKGGSLEKKEGAEKDFTLGPGQQRFDAAGKQLAAVDPKKPAVSDKIRNFEYHRELLKNDPLGAATFSKVTGSEYSPSPLKKLIGERQALIEAGEPADSNIVKAYDSKISGTDIDMENLTPDEVDTWGAYLNLTGKMPTLGRGKQSTKIRQQIVKSAAAQALGVKNFGEEDIEPDKTPAEAALSVLGEQSDTKSIQGSLNFLDKQLAAMGSFVENIDLQVNKVSKLSDDLFTFDTRLLNIPLRILRGKIAGSPLQAKYDMYLTEIESEIGKLATGSAASVAELSASAQEKWEKIHDKNLSVKDMMSLLEETSAAAKMRKQSVQTQLDLARSRMRREETASPEESQEITTQEAYNNLPSGTIYLEDGKKYRKP